MPLGAWVYDCNSSTGWKFWAWVPCQQIGILPLGGSFSPRCLGRGSEFVHWVEALAPGCLGMRLQFFHCVEVLGLGALPEIGILPLGGSFPHLCLGRGLRLFHWVEVFGFGCLDRGLGFLHWMEVFANGCLGWGFSFVHWVEMSAPRCLWGIRILPLGGSFCLGVPGLGSWIFPRGSCCSWVPRYRTGVSNWVGVFAPGCLSRRSDVFYWMEVFARWSLVRGLRLFHWLDVLPLGAWVGDW